MSNPPLSLEQQTSNLSLATTGSSSRISKSHRVLACILCQQRKIKCDRKFPCANCTKSRAQCVPATLTQRRRRRVFPQRELLERLRKYEDLLRQNHIPFDPLLKDQSTDKEVRSNESPHDSDEEPPEGIELELSTPSTGVKSESNYEAKNIWHAMTKGFRDPNNDSDSSGDDVRETEVRKAWEQAVENTDHLLFGSRNTNIDLSSLHPDPAQIFRMWQIYLENVDPILKVTHTSTLQPRVIEAASNPTGIEPNLEVLMFSIYCMSIHSLNAVECTNIFGSSKEDLLLNYHFGCQQALLNCGFLRTNDRDCLTGFVLYLISVKPSTVIQSLSSMLGLAIRIAHRMGIHSESTLTKCSILEAELRRRLWWTLVLFDTRIAEISGARMESLVPTWDCKIPVNINDSDLRPEMKSLPTVQKQLTENLLPVVRCEWGNFLRFAEFHLDFTTPALKIIAKQMQTSAVSDTEEITKMEDKIETQYFKSCDIDNPIHFMTIWTSRLSFAKARLLEHHSRFANSSTVRTEAQHDTATSHAIQMLYCDIQLLKSPASRRFRWLLESYFPFIAFIQIGQDLRRRPLCEQASLAWEVMSDDYDLRVRCFEVREHGPFMQLFTKNILSAWKACADANRQIGKEVIAPTIVSIFRKFAQGRLNSEPTQMTTETNTTDFSTANSMQMPVDFAGMGFPSGMSMTDPFSTVMPGMSGMMPSQPSPNMPGNQMNWNWMGNFSGW